MTETRFPLSRESRAAPAAPDEIFSIRDLLEILSRRRSIILAVVALISLPTLAYSALGPPLYTATASIMIEPKLVIHQRSPLGSVVDTQRDIINSPRLIEATMEDLNLYGVADFHDRWDKLRSLMQRIRNWTSDELNDDHNVLDEMLDEASTGPDAAGATAEAIARERAERRFAERLWIRQSGESLVLNVNFSASDPALAAKIANHMVTLYLQRQLMEKREEAEQAETWLSARIAAMRERVLEAERRLADFRSQHKFGLDQVVARSNSAVRYQELERQAEAKRATYAAMLSRYYENWNSVETIIPDARLIALANVPTKPSSPSGLLIAAVSLVASTILGCALALIREQTDRRIFSARQVEKTLGIRCLGSMPVAAQKQDIDKRQNRKQFAPARSLRDHAMNSLCMRVMATLPTPQTLLVTSPLAWEDKDLLAAEIAVAVRRMASDRVLLIDFDVDSGWVAKHVGICGDVHGTTAAMATGADHPPMPDRADKTVIGCTGDKDQDLKSLIVHDNLAGIDILPAGSKLNTDRVPPKAMMSSLLHELCPDYDFIVIDAPSLLNAPEAQVIAPFVDTTILVVHSGQTTCDQAEASLQLLHDIGARVLDIVLSQTERRQRTDKVNSASRKLSIKAESSRNRCKELKGRS